MCEQKIQIMFVKINKNLNQFSYFLTYILFLFYYFFDLILIVREMINYNVHEVIHITAC